MNLGKQKTISNCTNYVINNEDNSCSNLTKVTPSHLSKDDDKTNNIKNTMKASKLRPKTHRGVISGYSKLHYLHQLKYQSLFLAVDIFNTYLAKQQSQMSKQMLLKVALACFMMAIKVQQIYPPTLEQISRFYHLSNIQLDEYIQLQFKILSKLDFSLNFWSPIRYLFQKQANSLKNLKNLNKSQMSKVYLFLELACLEPNIYNKYTDITRNNRDQTSEIVPWLKIMKSINLIYSPLIDDARQDFDIIMCSKKLILAKTNLQNNHPFIYSKYKMDKFGNAALIHTYKPAQSTNNSDNNSISKKEQQSQNDVKQ